jgi:tripartite-type tricarboxylate transporter receptor subunit TctC
VQRSPSRTGYVAERNSSSAPSGGARVTGSQSQIASLALNLQPNTSIQYIKAGKLRALAVTSKTRADALPDVPTLAEFVPGYEASIWYGLGAPKGTPAEVIARLNAGVNTIEADPATKARLASIGDDPMPMTPAEFKRFIADETEKWGKVIRTAGVKAE